jgi:hypothetical protein
VHSQASADELSGGRAPLCFIVMPFGVKPDGRGGSVNFDAVCEELLAPAAREAGLVPLRGDQELVGGLIHKPMFERLVLADYAIVDISTANPNVFYELGVRHAVRPYSTVLVSAETKSIPFDLAPDRVFPYALDDDGLPVDLESHRAALVTALRAARDSKIDSPVFQLIDGLPPAEIDRLKTDVFRDQADYSATVKRKLAIARRKSDEALRTAEEELGELGDVEAGVLVDLLLSYRARSMWEEMARLAEAMPEPVRHTALVREQYAFALNRAGRDEEAESVLCELLAKHGPSSERLGLLGRVYKDRWKQERGRSDVRAAGFLDRAIATYIEGFETDWRDAYPGVNALTLSEVRAPAEPVQKALAPAVRYANRRRLAGGAADYWDQATRLELAVIERDEVEGEKAIRAALAAVRESWEPQSTAQTLAMIREARAQRGEALDWAHRAERELLRAATT